MTFPPLIIWAKGPFFFEQLFPVVARTWLGEKSGTFFLGPKFRFLAKKSDFCHTTPIFVDDPFLALGMTVYFPPWKPFFDFPFRSYSCFRKKIWLKQIYRDMKFISRGLPGRCEWPKTAKTRGEPQKMTPSSETENFLGVVLMGKL